MTEKDILVEITNDGTCVSIWDDHNPLQAMGDLQVVRLSDVEFDPHLQEWVVKFRNGVTLPNTYPRRIEALNAEITYAEAHLGELAEWVKTQLREDQPLQPKPAYVDASMS
jgi:hypothetical protein